jgi:hypothetical protein
MPESANFHFLREYDPIFLQLACAAESAFVSDPNTTLIKLRQLAEALAQDLAARAGIVFDEQTTQSDLLWKLGREINLDPTVRNLFHTLRIEGNKATHQFRTQHKEALGAGWAQDRARPGIVVPPVIQPKQNGFQSRAIRPTHGPQREAQKPSGRD